MKKVIQACLFIIPVLFFVSCQEDEAITDLAKIEENLKDYVRETNVSKCTITIVQGDRSNFDPQPVEFEIEDGFLIVKQDSYARYNLLYLLQYYISSDGYLQLTFRW